VWNCKLEKDQGLDGKVSRLKLSFILTRGLELDIQKTHVLFASFLGFLMNLDLFLYCRLSAWTCGP
jgi:hypothetical protein